NQRKELAATRTPVGPRCGVSRRNAISHAVLGWARSKWWVELRVHISQSLPLLTHQPVRTDSSDSWRSSFSVHQVERRLEQREGGCGEARQAELIPEQVHHREAAPRADDLWRLWQPRKGGGAVNRVFEPAE